MNYAVSPRSASICAVSKGALSHFQQRRIKWFRKIQFLLCYQWIKRHAIIVVPTMEVPRKVHYKTPAITGNALSEPATARCRIINPRL